MDNLISQGANVLIVLAQDGTAIKPSVASAVSNGVPVIAYDRLIEDARTFYLTFDNVEVGRMQARAVLAAMPKGRYVMIKGSPVDPNADFLRGGQQEVLQAAQAGRSSRLLSEQTTTLERLARHLWETVRVPYASLLPDADHGTVEFVARSKLGGRAHRLHEVSEFVREGGRWFYLRAQV